MKHTKELTLKVTFSNVQDLTEILIDMHTHILKGSRYHKERMYESKNQIDHIADYEFFLTPVMKNQPYREELINGVWCCVYPSKMNN